MTTRRAIEWYARYIDARFSQDEASEWQALVLGGMGYDAATQTLIARRSEEASESPVERTEP